MKTLFHIRVVTKLNKDAVNVLLGQIWAIYTAMSAHQAQFQNPVVAMATLLALWEAASNAQKLVQTRAPGSAAARDAELAPLLTAVESLRAYVEGLCANLALEQATALAAAAGMKIAAPPVHGKPALQAKRGSVSGNVVLLANALLLAGKGRGRKLFNWEWSADGGKTWVGLPATTDATTTVSGLTPLTIYLFRVSCNTRKVVGAWSQAVSLVVH